MVPRWTGNRPYMRKSWANPVISVLCTKEPTRGHLIKYNNNNNSIRYSFGLTHLCKWDDIFKPTSFWWLCKCWFSDRSVESLHPYWLFEKNAVEDFHWLYFAILCLPFRHGFKSQWQWFGDAIICPGDSVINIDVWVMNLESNQILKSLKGLTAFLNRLFTSSSLNRYDISIKIENKTELGSAIQVKAPPTPSDGNPTLSITVSIGLGFNK